MSEWINKYLVDTPPAPTFSSQTNNTIKIVINWINPTRFQLGFMDVLVLK